MARPEKSGLDYFPLDVGFLRNKKVKLLKTEFGANSVIFVLYVLSRVYEEEGYYLRWDKDECLMAAEEIGCGITPSYIGEVLQRCLSRSLFDQRVFQMFGVLTSAGIQRRYLKGKEKRDEIVMIEEYFLLDIENKKDVPDGILAKLALKKVSEEKTGIISSETRVISTENPQSKEKESKEKKSIPARTREAFEAVWETYPKKAGKEKAMESFMALPEDDQRRLLSAVKQAKRSEAFTKEHGRFIPQLANFISREDWKQYDEPIGFDLDEIFDAACRRGETHES
jgi:hypothetical protein